MQFSKCAIIFILQGVYLCIIHIHRARISYEILHPMILQFSDLLWSCDLIFGTTALPSGCFDPRSLFIGANLRRQFTVLSVGLLIYCSYYHIVDITNSLAIFFASYCIDYTASIISESIAINTCLLLDEWIASQ